MSELVSTTNNGVPLEDPADHEPRYDTPYDMRVDLEAIGIVEHERGVCEDTFENRAILRKNLLNWDPVYDANGVPTGLIAARSKEATKTRRLLSLAEKRPLLMDPKDNNSDYVTGLDLLVDDALCSIVPPWVVGATKRWNAEQDGSRRVGPKAEPSPMPHRCRMIKSDGIRCLLWASGRKKDDGLCRVHLRTVRKPGEDVERARLKLVQAAPFAVDVLEELMETAQSEPVRLKASTEILDRAGIRGGYDFSVDVEVTDSRPAHEVISERLARLTAGAEAILAAQARAEAEITDGEVVEENPDA